MKGRKLFHPVGVYCGSLYYVDIQNGEPRSIMQNPAVLINIKEDIIHKYGDEKGLIEILPRYQNSLDKMALLFKGDTDYVPEKAHVISLSNLSVEQQAYVIIRMMEYTATGFIKNFGEHVLQDKTNDWLLSEMIRIPIDDIEIKL